MLLIQAFRRTKTAYAMQADRLALAQASSLSVCSAAEKISVWTASHAMPFRSPRTRS